MRIEPNNRGHKQQQFSMWNVMAITVITLLIGIGLYILFEDQTDHESQWKKPQHEIQQPGTEEQPQRTYPGNTARAIIARIKADEATPDLDDIYAKAMEFSDASRFEDAHLLLFYSARLGHVPSARSLGGMYDPNHFNTSKSIIDEPDLTQAYKWYKIAADSGDEVATERLKTLKTAVRKEADKGSEEAKALLLRWKWN